MHSILLVSKPLAPPWNDSGKNWARDIARYASQGVVHHVMVPRGSDAFLHTPNVVPEAVYRDEGGFTPALWQKSRTLMRLLRRTCDVVHFCFAPNPRTNAFAAAAMRWRRQPCVHTVLSVPASFEGIERVLFADRVVAVSAWTAAKLREAGLAAVHHIPAAIPVPPPLREADPARVAAALRRLGLEGERPLVLFPGDYEFSRAADTFADAIDRCWEDTGARFVFACRTKSPAALAREAALRQRLAAPARQGRVRFLRQVDDMEALLAAAALVTFPAESSFAKMDLPLVLLEALAQRTPLVLADVDPQREVLPDPAEAHGGLRVPPLDADALADALAALLRDDARRARMGEAGRRHVLSHHDAAAICRRYLDVYASL